MYKEIAGENNCRREDINLIWCCKTPCSQFMIQNAELIRENGQPDLTVYSSFTIIIHIKCHNPQFLYLVQTVIQF